MKKRTLIYFTIFLFTLVSCSKETLIDNTVNEITDYSLYLGKWYGIPNKSLDSLDLKLNNRFDSYNLFTSQMGIANNTDSYYIIFDNNIAVMNMSPFQPDTSLVFVSSDSLYIRGYGYNR
jgi:lipocalin